MEKGNTFYIINQQTDKIIDVSTDYKRACAICDAHAGTHVETECGAIVYSNAGNGR